MSLYLAGPNRGVVSPNFRERGIANMQPAEIDELLIIPLSKTKVSHAYASAMANIPAILNAQKENTFYIWGGKPISMFKHIKNVSTFEAPVGTFMFQGMDDDKARTLSALGLQREPGSTTTYTGTPKVSDLSTIFSQQLIKGRFTPGKISSDAYLAYGALIRGLHVFTTISAHVSFNQLENIFLQKSSSEEAGNSKVFSIRGVENRAKSREFAGDDVGSAHVIFHAQFGPITGHGNLDAFVLLQIEPAQQLPLIADNCMYFPYFHGMLLADKVKAWHVFSGLFSDCLGDENTTISMLQSIRTGCRQLAFSAAGMALSHAYTGVEIAMKLGAALVLVISNGQYHGFAIQSQEPFSIKTSSATCASLEKSEVEEKIKAAGGSLALLGEIVNILNAPVKDGGMPVYIFSVESIRTARMFVSVWNSVDKDLYTDDQKKNLRTKLANVVFPAQKFAPVTVGSLKIFLDYVESGNKSLLEDFGAYTSGAYWEDCSRVAVGLGIFGSRAPSLNYSQSGQTFSFPADIAADDPCLKVNAEGKRSLSYLPLQMTPTRNAIVQWNNLFAKGNFTIPNARRNKKEFTDGSTVDFKVQGDPAFLEVYRAIKIISSGVRAGLRAGKRARAGDDDESGPSNSKKKARKEHAALAMDM